MNSMIEKENSPLLAACQPLTFGEPGPAPYILTSFEPNAGAAPQFRSGDLSKKISHYHIIAMSSPLSYIMQKTNNELNTSKYITYLVSLKIDFKTSNVTS